MRCAIHESVEAAVKYIFKPEPGLFCPCPHEPPNHIAVVVQVRSNLLLCCETNERVEDTKVQPCLAWYRATPERGEHIIACIFHLVTLFDFVSSYSYCNY